MIIGTVAVYGIAAAPLARLLKLAEETSRGVLIAGADAWVRDFAAELKAAGVPVLLVDTNYNKISQARMAGLRGECANILNEHAREDLDLAGIGRLLAMTPNDEVNSLALRECRTLFDSSRLYQLTFKSKNTAGRRGLTKNLMGRELFGEGLTFTRLSEMHAAGASLKTTKLTESFSFADFQEKYGEVTTVLCAITSEGGLNINTVDAPLVPAAGQTILALVSSTPVPDKHAVKASKKRTESSQSEDAQKNDEASSSDGETKA